jgi:glycosyltransferase involved in cell wall biosynthesis
MASIAGQECGDWELIVVDDGSTDDTRAVIERWTPKLSQPVKYVWQENGGAYAARNTGLDHVSGEYVAFFDSDDLWLPHHLSRCVEVLSGNPDVDWVFAACRSVDADGHVVAETTFEDNGRPRRFLALQHRVSGRAHVIEDPHAIECHLLHGIYAGLQNSVIRATVFAADRFQPDSRVVDDTLFLLRAMKRGARLAFLPDVHVIYRIHGDNSSGSAAGASREKLLRVYREYEVGLERIRRAGDFTGSQRRALNKCLARHYFWHIGYACEWMDGKRREALRSMGKGLRLDPLNLPMFKTYLVSHVKVLLHV